MSPNFKIKPSHEVDDETLKALALQIVEVAKIQKLRPTIVAVQVLDYVKHLRYLPSKDLACSDLSEQDMNAITKHVTLIKD